MTIIVVISGFFIQLKEGCFGCSKITVLKSLSVDTPRKNEKVKKVKNIAVFGCFFGENVL